jgi:hypothetical protein
VHNFTIPTEDFRLFKAKERGAEKKKKLRLRQFLPFLADMHAT